MTIHRTLALMAAAATVTPACAQEPLPINQDAGQVAQRLDEHMRRLVPFGYSGSLLVARDGQIVLSNGYGLADRENSVPVTAETVFDIGSITKQFTAAAILKLEMEGKLSVNDPVSRWFPDVPADKQGMTLHHLLTHSSGLRGQFGGDYAVAERDSLAGVILSSELQWEPGTRYDYSNAGYSLLGMVVEKASGMGYEPYLREKLWAPAGMTRTGYVGVQWRPGELAVGYARGGRRNGTPAEQRWAEDGPWWNLRANGGVLSTVTDLFRWHQALEGDAILSAEAKRKMWTPHVPEDEEGSSHYGYGWAIFNTARGTKLIAHNGGNGIFFADFRRYVDEGVLILVMSNSADAPAERTLQAATRTVFGGGPVTAPPVAVDGDPARASAVVGSYRLPGGGTLQVAADGARLTIRPQGQEAYALLNGGSGDARLAALGAQAVAMLEAAGRNDYEPLRQAFGGEMPAQRMRQMHEEFMARFRELGGQQAVEHVGTSARGPMAQTLVRIRFERGDQLLRVGWEDGRVAGIQPMRETPPALFVPVAADAWASYDFASGASTRVRFEGGALVIDTPTGPVRASRS